MKVGRVKMSLIVRDDRLWKLVSSVMANKATIIALADRARKEEGLLLVRTKTRL